MACIFRIFLILYIIKFTAFDLSESWIIQIWMYDVVYTTLICFYNHNDMRTEIMLQCNIHIWKTCWNETHGHTAQEWRNEVLKVWQKEFQLSHNFCTDRTSSLALIYWLLPEVKNYMILCIIANKILSSNFSSIKWSDI